MAVPSTIYQDVIDWALSQQTSEAVNGQPANLAPTVRKALLELHQLVKPAPSTLAEPDLGDIDWISLLQRKIYTEYSLMRRATDPGTSGYRDANPTPLGITIRYLEKPLEDSPSHQQRWLCYVSLYEYSSKPLPLPDPATGKVPSFGRKKDAKKYAAKCAVEWLMSQRRMPDNGKDVSFTRQNMAPVAPQKRQRTNTPSPPPPRAASAAGSEESPPPPPTPMENAKTLFPSEPDQKPRTPSRSSLEGPDVVKQVADLCTALGANPPIYVTTRGDGDFSSGFAKLSDVFEDRGLPPDFGHVSNIYGGKKNVREAVAEVLLKELRKIEAEREAIVDEIFRDLPPPVR